MAWAVTAGMGVFGAYSANEFAKANNRAVDASQEEAERRYALKSGIAKNQMTEQGTIARDKMTEISRAFIKAKGTATALQAESGVGGNVEQRKKFTNSIKFSEAKGKVAEEINTNNINIAQGMLASKIDTESMIANAEASRKNVMLETVIGGIQGGMQGYSLGSGASISQTKGTSTVGSKQSPIPPATETYFNGY